MAQQGRARHVTVGQRSSSAPATAGSCARQPMRPSSTASALRGHHRQAPTGPRTSTRSPRTGAAAALHPGSAPRRGWPVSVRLHASMFDGPGEPGGANSTGRVNGVLIWWYGAAGRRHRGPCGLAGRHPASGRDGGTSPVRPPRRVARSSGAGTPQPIRGDRGSWLPTRQRLSVHPDPQIPLHGLDPAPRRCRHRQGQTSDLSAIVVAQRQRTGWW
jgi:hypothetical protein